MSIFGRQGETLPLAAATEGLLELIRAEPGVEQARLRQRFSGLPENPSGERGADIEGRLIALIERGLIRRDSTLPPGINSYINRLYPEP